MKKYVSLIVCAVITLAALLIPIGSGARYDGKGPGKNKSVTNLNELSNALQSSSATYTMTYSEGINISRHSLNIYKENYQAETDISKVIVYQDESLLVRVSDLHRNDNENTGKLYDKIDFVNFVDYNMDTGIVKIKYQTDFYGRTADSEGNPISQSQWIGEGFSSASDLGLDTKEATDTIAVYSDNGKTTKVMDIAKGQIFILESEENGTKTIKYSLGNGFETGYISSSSHKDVYVSCFFDETIEKAIKLAIENGESYDIVKISNKEETKSGVNYFSENICQDPRSGAIYHGTTYRYYSSGKTTYKGLLDPEPQTINYEVISVNVEGEWVTNYCKTELVQAFRVDSSSYEKPFTGNYDRGTIKVFKTADAVYAQVESEMTLAHNTTNIRTTINAEFIIKGDKNLIKINSFFYDDDSGKENKNKGAMEFLTGSADGTTFGESKIKLNQWVNAKDAKIYFDTTTRPADEFINPLNFFIDKYFNADGSLKQNDFLASLIDLKLLEQDGQEAFVKSSVKEAEVCEGLYYQIIGNNYNEFIPQGEVENTVKKGSIDIDFSNKKLTVIKSRFQYTLPSVSVFDASSNATSKFESASDRTITIENVGNTVIPKVVMNEVKGLLG